MKKRTLPLLLALTLCLALAIPALAADVGVVVNGSAVRWADAEPFIDGNGRTMVPLRAVADALGLEVKWNNEYRMAIFSKGSKSIAFIIDVDVAFDENDVPIQMDTSAVIRNSRTYAPVRYLAEHFGYTVGWDNTARTVKITGGLTPNSERPLVPDADDFDWFDARTLRRDGAPEGAIYMKNASDVAGNWKAYIIFYDKSGNYTMGELATVNIAPTASGADVTFTWTKVTYAGDAGWRDASEFPAQTWQCRQDTSAAGYFYRLVGSNWFDNSEMTLQSFWHFGGQQQFGFGRWEMNDDSGYADVALMRP